MKNKILDGFYRRVSRLICVYSKLASLFISLSLHFKGIFALRSPHFQGIFLLISL